MKTLENCVLIKLIDMAVQLNDGAHTWGTEEAYEHSQHKIENERKWKNWGTVLELEMEYQQGSELILYSPVFYVPMGRILAFRKQTLR